MTDFICPEGGKIVVFDLDPDLARIRVQFPNEFGASIIRNAFTYGGSEGLWEVAVLWQDEIDYDSGITDDVLGWLTMDDVNETLVKIAALPIRQKN
jgi:hypothetical protein